MSRPGILDSLSADQLDDLIGWMDDPSIKMQMILERVAAPPPEGFGIKTHVTSLRRLYRRQKLRQAQEDLALARMGHLNADELAQIRRSAAAALTRLAFETASGHAPGAAQLTAAMKWLESLQERELKLEQMELRRRQLAHEQRKLQMAAVFKQTDCRRQADIDRITNAATALKEPL